jgi:hypothetical protein
MAGVTLRAVGAVTRVLNASAALTHEAYTTVYLKTGVRLAPPIHAIGEVTTVKAKARVGGALTVETEGALGARHVVAVIKAHTLKAALLRATACVGAGVVYTCALHTREPIGARCAIAVIGDTATQATVSSCET